MNVEKPIVGNDRGILAMDQGYSYCKVKTDVRMFKFPTAVAPKRTSAIAWDTDNESYFFNDRDYILGEPALKSDWKMFNRAPEFLLESSPLLVAHALHLLDRTEPPQRLIVGLPLAHYHLHKAKLKNILTTFTVNGVLYNFEVMVIAQGLGALADYVNTVNPVGNEDGFLFDVGFNTVIALRYNNLIPQRDSCQQFDQFGISRPLEEISNALKMKYSYSIDLISLNHALLKGWLPGSDICLNSIAEPIMDLYFQELFSYLDNAFGRYFQASMRIVLSGGGAYFLRNYFPAQYRKKVYVSLHPEYANVRGFYYFGR